MLFGFLPSAVARAAAAKVSGDQKAWTFSGSPTSAQEGHGELSFVARQRAEPGRVSRMNV